MPLPMNSTAKRLGNGAGVEAMAFNDSSQGKAIVTPTPRRTVRLESFIAFTSTPGARRDCGGNGPFSLSPPCPHPSGGRNFTQTGDGADAKTPDGVNRPFPASIRHIRTVLES